MQRPHLLDHFLVRNLLGLGALLAVHYLADWYAIDQRAGLGKVSPYFYLLLLYGWIVFHNRILFERLFLRDKKSQYFGWLFLLMALGSFNMNFVLHTEFNITRSLPHLVNFWVYTVTGVGVYSLYRYLRPRPVPTKLTPPAGRKLSNEGYFSCTVDGIRETIPYETIQYIESLENYLKIITYKRTFITRLTMKEAEERLPRPIFIRISRSMIVNMTQADRKEPDAVWIGGKELKIGKVYKRYVAEQLAGAEGQIR